MTADTAAPALAATARNVMDRIRYMVLGTIDEDGCTRTSPVYFVPPRYRDLYWVSSPTSHHSHNLKRDNRLSAVIFDSTVPPGPDQQAVYVAGTAREVQPAALAKHLPRAFRPERGARAFTAEELTGEADLRLWVLRVDRWEVHISGAHPTLGSGTDRRTPVDPTE
jgi:nitroimidazol reductase NimA-like FMN-containing flavoprotein (pyridoxamine 5'-phosphate oxidase superfamily)